MNNLATAQRAYDSLRPASYSDNGKKHRRALESATALFILAIQRGNPDKRIPVEGAVKNITLDVLLTYISTDAARLLLAACAQSLKLVHTESRSDSDQACGALLRTFVMRVADEYAADNVEGWL